MSRRLYHDQRLVKWAICLDSEGLLDDLQAILTNLASARPDHKASADV